jgi:peptidase E
MAGKTQQIIPIGGGGFYRDPENLELEKYVIRQSGAENARVAFVPTASGEPDHYVASFYAAFLKLGCRPSVLTFFKRTPDLRSFLLDQDVIYVGGGNTANMLAIWRVHGIDRALREAWSRGAVLGGMSAGANCWFEGCVTDSFGPMLRDLPDGLGILSGSFCPHYDGEPERRPTYTRLVGEGLLPPGYAADDNAAFHFHGRELREVVSQRDGARGYRVTAGGEEPIEPRLL